MRKAWCGGVKAARLAEPWPALVRFTPNTL